MKTVVLAGTFGVRGEEFAYIKSLLGERGVLTYTIHTGIQEPLFEPDVNNVELARLGGGNLKDLLAKGNTRFALTAISKGLKVVVPKLYKEGRLDGMLSLGGSSDTATITSAMRLLPIGQPKLMITTMASGYVADYIETSDILLMPSIVNAAGLNRISRMVYENAVNAIVGMVQRRNAPDDDVKPMIAISTFSLTSSCTKHARRYLEDNGYEVLEFSCTGAGGRTMEELIGEGLFVGVLDLTTTEWCDELMGGILGAGPTRCDAAIVNRVPQVVSVGCTDMVNFGPVKTVPQAYARRNLYRHNANITLMRTTAVECAKVGDILADKWNNAHCPMVVLLPERGVSQLDAKGQPFDDPDARQAMFDAIEERVFNPHVKVQRLDLHVNDAEFAEMAAQQLIELIEGRKK